MALNQTEIRVQGRPVMVPSVELNGNTVITTGKWLKTAALRDEELVEGDPVGDPKLFVKGLKDTALPADILTFSQRLPDITPRYAYYLEWESMAAIRITTFQDWLHRRVEYDVRKALKKAAKLGVSVRTVAFDDALISGIVRIYNESPIRQGKRFWHYQKSFETVKMEKSTYLERSEFIGAYYENELIGFIKMVYVDRIASTLHVISRTKHASKKPTNALIAKAVDICEQKKITHLVYGNYRYGDMNSSLTEFKRRNGFEEICVPRYYIPLTAKGRLCLELGLHHGIKPVLPRSILRALRSARSKFYKLQLAGKSNAQAESQ